MIGIACPKCAVTTTRVIDSRAADNKVRRRRVCTVCRYRFTTTEIVAVPTTTKEVKGDKKCSV